MSAINQHKALAMGKANNTGGSSKRVPAPGYKKGGRVKKYAMGGPTLPAQANPAAVAAVGRPMPAQAMGRPTLPAQANPAAAAGIARRPMKKGGMVGCSKY